MVKDQISTNSGHGFYKGIGSHSLNSGIGIEQCLPDKKKTKAWRKAVMDSLENIGQNQRLKNRHFLDYYEMIQGKFTYAGTGAGEFQEMHWFDSQIRTLREEQGVPTYIKHYDFIGIIVNTLLGIYLDFKDVYRVESKDEYSTNEFIREKTDKLQQYAIETFQNELTRRLMAMGIDPFKNDFETEEEYQQYQQQLTEKKKAMTPDEIDQYMAKNFKVLATEWAQNTLDEDRKRFLLDSLDREEFIDRLLTGRWFRHHRVGFDYYTIERWRPDEAFFSEDVNAKYPQKGEFVGRTHFHSSSDIINLFGHLMTAEEQEKVSGYWNQVNDWQDAPKGSSTEALVKSGFGQDQVIPFKDFYTHDLLKGYESALGVPLGERTLVNKDGEEYTVNDWLPEYNGANILGAGYAKEQRSDIDVRNDLIQVTEAYWRSYKRIGLVTYENSQGVLIQTLVTDDLLDEFLTENEIKKLKNVTLDDILKAKRADDLRKYKDTIVYQYVPEVWKGVKIKANSTNLKDDLYLDVRPLDFQIKSNSDFYNFELPVTGLITWSVAGKIAPYQVLHNICMNQIMDILEREVGIFFLMDITYLPSEYKDNGDHEDALLQLMNTAINTGIMPVDMSKQNTQGNQPVNSFQRQDLTYGTQVQYRMELAQAYKQMALDQIGITPQLLGQPNTYVTAEGIKQGAQASYAQLNPIFDEMNESKALSSDVHLAIAQWCQANNVDTVSIYTNSDGDTSYLNIMNEDPKFPLRKLGVVSVTGSRDRKVIETMRAALLQNNTITQNVNDLFEIFTSDTIIELKAIAKENERRINAERQEAMAHQEKMQQMQIEAAKAQQAEQNQFTKELADEKNMTDLEEARIDATAKVNQKNYSQEGTDAIIKATQDGINNSFKQADLAIKQQNIDNKNSQERDKLMLKVQELAMRSRELDIKERGQELTHLNSVINKN